jgi:hypothetical protein
MDHIRFSALWRAVTTEAAARGFHGDPLADPSTLPPLGTLYEEMAIVSIAMAAWPAPRDRRERQLRNLLARAAVMGPTASAPTSEPVAAAQAAPETGAVARAAREAIAARRRLGKRRRP